jgi:hypothetical protein
LNRLFLHAWRLVITLPDGEQKIFEAPLDERLNNVVANLRSNS